MRFIAFHLMQAHERHTDPEVYRNEIELMVLAEDLGFDAVWMAEHHFLHYGIDPDPLLLATHVAARTKRIRIGTAANILTLVHPLRIAEQGAMLDVLSNGRVDIGFAKGYGPREFAGYGIDQRKADERFAEAMEVIIRAWTQPEFSFEGKHFRIPLLSLRPRPVTKPHPRTFIATTGSAATLGLAARFSIPFYVAYRGRAHFQTTKENFTRIAREQGRSDAEIQRVLSQVAIMQTSYLAPTSQESYDEARAGVNWMSDAVDAVNIPDNLDQWPKDLQDVVRSYHRNQERGYRDYDKYWKGFIYGDTARAIERVGRLKEAGIENVLIGFSFGGLPFDKVRRSMELFARDVMPKFR
ncbi:MAG: LLM class flavin-dependent oxidoreductase [Chloroflexi bacterium]|nr:LLM class flavin-dependent oxidoreductase [Chloroflexota bacterium]